MGSSVSVHYYDWLFQADYIFRFIYSYTIIEEGVCQKLSDENFKMENKQNRPDYILEDFHKPLDETTLIINPSTALDHEFIQGSCKSNGKFQNRLNDFYVFRITHHTHD